VSPPGCEKPIGIAILGSTGSVGRQTLDVIDANPDRFRVVSLAARSASPRLMEQIARYQPAFASVAEEGSFAGDPGPVLHHGAEGLIIAATLPDVDIVVVATAGHAAIAPTMRAIEHGKTIALANKETLVCAGELIVPLAAAHGVQIRPVDSEHSAIWQSLAGAPLRQVRRIIITASGGPFRTTPAADLARVTAKEALAHPTWSMGEKITVDSATLMNKGLEIIEAHWLFGLPYNRIDVVVHPESVIHSLVEFVDGGQIAQLGLPDMRLPIQYALSYPERLPTAGRRLELSEIGALHFEEPDGQRFPALRLAREAGSAGRTFPTVLSAADDEAVSAFLSGSLRFVDIPWVVQRVMERHVPEQDVTLDAVMAADAWARAAAQEAITETCARR
jgi:1-deoxy-D-xylulose-5-phosphate reductoisomerase